MENDIEIKSYKLLDSLEVHEMKSEINVSKLGFENQYRGWGTSEILRIENDNIINSVFTEINPKTNKKFLKIRFGNQFIILSEEKYELLTEIIYSLFNLDFFSVNTTYDFIEKNIINWIVQCCSDKRVSLNLINFLYDSVDSNAKEYIFYFIIDSLAIEKPFNLITTEIIYLTDEMIINEYKKLQLIRETSKEEIEKFFKEYKSAIIAKVKVKGIKEKASLIAKEKATLALSVFKIFFSHESVNDYYQMFDLNFKSRRLSPYTYIHESSNNEFDFEQVLEIRHGVSPIFVNDRILERIANENIIILLEFISTYNVNEFTNLLVNSINDLADSFSIRNYHERVSKIITFFEGILLPKNHTKGEGETYLKNNVLSKMCLLEDDNLFAKKIIRNFYQIRHKYLHNKLELPIELNELDVFQYFALKFIFLLVNKSKEISTLHELYNFLNIKS